ncbi:hypothetical protein CDD82_3526 [Ophiocordyceps australis]|uniref:Transcription initiation factor TFIID subunit 4 n=1 Tax=Ophiocordyceps australis TaxID=1399860 RepID=A0A2C5ZSZ3_9HYPO|nr:hypothetical protein CDD82_3526 [Ophiocordyceps australis]
MAHPQPQAPSRAFSPPQHSPSPVGSQSAYSLPPNKRIRTDGPSSQPASPYTAPPAAVSPPTGNTPPLTAPSPKYAPTPPAMPSPSLYTNGNAAGGLTLPDIRATNATPPVAPSLPQPQYTNATMVPIPLMPTTPAQAMVMGPPQRPADKPSKDYEYDVTDSLAGTGIDLRAEEQFMADLYSRALESSSDARTGFARHPAGNKTSFYGANQANQPPDPNAIVNQAQAAAKAAERAWTEASTRLALQRTQEIKDPFLEVATIHRRAERCAREFNLGLNLDVKSNQGIGKMRLPEQFPAPEVTVRMHQGPDSTIVHTTGSFIPKDAFLVDQIALLSIATKQRLRDLVEEANVLATNRQKTSHGEIPDEWQAAAAPLNLENLDSLHTDVEMTDAVNAFDSGTNPLKRSPSVAGLEDGRPLVRKMAKIASAMLAPMRERARQDRDWEEARLRRRQKRKEGNTDSAPAVSRAGSVAPATPGSVAPEPEKTMTKKEMKKNQALKAAEANSHANQNLTSSMFAGLGGKGGLFGKKKGGRTYDWMNVGRNSSGTNTPTRGSQGAKGLNGLPANAPTNHPLTSEGRNRLGAWREDREKGKGIQLRDWVTVLERDGRERRALALAYAGLDSSHPK